MGLLIIVGKLCIGKGIGGFDNTRDKINDYNNCITMSVSKPNGQGIKLISTRNNNYKSCFLQPWLVKLAKHACSNWITEY